MFVIGGIQQESSVFGLELLTNHSFVPLLPGVAGQNNHKLQTANPKRNICLVLNYLVKKKERK